MAAVTVEDVCNQALTILAEASIESLEENNRPARLLNTHFESTRQAELSKHAWAFAIYRVELDAIADADMPVGETYGYGYTVPDDALRVLDLTHNGEAHGVSIPHKREGNLILSNYEGPRLIRYIANLTDPDDWDPLFVKVLAAALAAEIAYALTGKESAETRAYRRYEMVVADARRLNAIESGSVFRAQSWASARGDTSELY